MNIWAVSVAFICGLLVPFQGIVNSKLSVDIGNPMVSALVSFAGGFLIFAVATFFGPWQVPSLSKIMSQPPVLLSGGLIGAIFLISAIILLPKLGSTAWVALIVAGQLVMSLIVDHYGILGLPVMKMNIMRVGGVVLLFLGTTILNKF